MGEKYIPMGLLGAKPCAACRGDHMMIDCPRSFGPRSPDPAKVAAVVEALTRLESAAAKHLDIVTPWLPDAGRVADSARHLNHEAVAARRALAALEGVADGT